MTEICDGNGHNGMQRITLCDMTFAEKLNDLMRRHGDSNETLATKLTDAGCEASRELVRRMANGADPRLSVIRAISQVYCVPVPYLCDDGEVDPSASAVRPSEDERVILRMARVLGTDRAIKRLVDPPILGTAREMGLLPSPDDPSV
jgi:hypothetical protein